MEIGKENVAGGAHQWVKRWGTEAKNSAGSGYSRDPMCWGAESWGPSTRCAVGSGQILFDLSLTVTVSSGRMRSDSHSPERRWTDRQEAMGGLY